MEPVAPGQYDGALLKNLAASSQTTEFHISP